MRWVGPGLPSSLPIPLDQSKDILRKLRCCDLDLDVGIIAHEALDLVELDGTVREHDFEVRLVVGAIRKFQVVALEAEAVDLASLLKKMKVTSVSRFELVHALLNGCLASCGSI